MHEIGRCLLDMNEHDKALTYYERALQIKQQIKQRATTNAETDQSLAVTLHEIGRCLVDMNEHDEALKYYERALQIKQRTSTSTNVNNEHTTNAETDTSLAATLHEIGRCLQDMNQHDEALKQQIDYECLQGMNQHDEEIL